MRVVAGLAVLGMAVEIVHAIVPDQRVGIDVVLPDADLGGVEREPEAARQHIELLFALTQLADVFGSLVDEPASDEERDEDERTGDRNEDAEGQRAGQRRLPAAAGA